MNSCNQSHVRHQENQMPTEKLKPQKAPHAGSCYVCGLLIYEGDRIYIVPGPGQMTIAAHQVCYEQENETK